MLSQPSEGVGLSLSQGSFDGSSFDETKKTVVQFIEVPMKDYTLADNRSLKPIDENAEERWEEFFKAQKKKGKELEAWKTKLFVEKITKAIEAMDPVESTRLDEILEEEVSVTWVALGRCDHTCCECY